MEDKFPQRRGNLQVRQNAILLFLTFQISEKYGIPVDFRPAVMYDEDVKLTVSRGVCLG
jgi:hypothetical protein